MANSGTLVLINVTPYPWLQTKVHSYQMDDWLFPTTIDPGVITRVHVQYDDSLFASVSDDGGEVYFALEGTSNTLQIQARAPKGIFTLQAVFDGISAVGAPQGSIINLGWVGGGATPFVLGGETGAFWSTGGIPSDWMQHWLPNLGHKPLLHLSIPGSHDAGMTTITGGTVYGDSSDAQTQTLSILDQLKLGSRYLDLRPVITGGHFSAGHYDNAAVVGWQGANGETFDTIISEINSFTSTNKELIILNLSGDLNTDVGRSYRPLNQDEWYRLFQQLLGINHLFIAPNPTTVDLASLTLNQYIGGGQAAVLIIFQPSDSSTTLGQYAGHGFYTYQQFGPYNHYTNTDNLDKMTNDQLTKLNTVRKTPDSPLFLLSWTLTGNLRDILGGTSILDLANRANSELYTKLASNITDFTYPNIIFIDNFANSSLTALQIWYNTELFL